MANTGIVRRIDDLGRIVIPKELRHNMRIQEGEALEFIPQYNHRTGSTELVIRRFRKSFAQCAIDWYNQNPKAFRNCQFRIEDDYTFCIVRDPEHPSRAGFAKLHKGDDWNGIVGRVAAYAKAMGRNLNKMIGYEED